MTDDITKALGRRRRSSSSSNVWRNQSTASPICSSCYVNVDMRHCLCFFLQGQQDSSTDLQSQTIVAQCPWPVRTGSDHGWPAVPSGWHRVTSYHRIATVTMDTARRRQSVRQQWLLTVEHERRARRGRRRRNSVSGCNVVLAQSRRLVAERYVVRLCSAITVRHLNVTYLYNVHTCI